jgi:N-dimethylarginine dimethylaminohydrolase
MLRIAIEPNTFVIKKSQDNQNPYIHHVPVDKVTVQSQHDKLFKALPTLLAAKFEPHVSVPDLVFVANGGLALPRFGRPVVILPYMKYAQRKRELPYLKQLLDAMHITTIPFPGSQDAPFEGQAELKWFHGGTKAICGPGYRSTPKTFTILEKLLRKLYTAEGLHPPELLVVPIECFDYYHLDVAMLEYDDSKCIVHSKAFSAKSIEKIRAFLGAENVTVLDTDDSFCLNAIIDGKRLVTHKLQEVGLKKTLEDITAKKIYEVETSEFEKSGGSVRCMVLDIFL